MRSNDAMARTIVCQVDRIGLARERLGEHALIAQVGAQSGEELLLLAGHAELDRIGPEQGDLPPAARA